MTAQRAIEILNNYGSLFPQAEQKAIDVAVLALKKQIPIKAVKFDKYYYKCPVCGMSTGVSEEDMTIYEIPQPNYCKECGQALDL